MRGKDVCHISWLCSSIRRAGVKVFLVAVVLDGIYQFITVRWFYPGEALVTALVLATASGNADPVR